MIVLYIVLAVIVIFLAVILIRAALFRPHPELVPSGEKVELDEKKIVNDMVEMIRCKTVSYNDESLIDKEEFRKFQDLLPKLYPKVHEICPREFVGVNGMLYRWKGKKPEDPVVLMAHYDVVPVEEALWDKPAFEGIVEDGVIWGRGTLDTKGTFCGIIEAAEKLITEGFVPDSSCSVSFACTVPAEPSTSRSREVVSSVTAVTVAGGFTFGRSGYSGFAKKGLQRIKRCGTQFNYRLDKPQQLFLSAQNLLQSAGYKLAGIHLYIRQFRRI